MTFLSLPLRRARSFVSLGLMIALAACTPISQTERPAADVTTVATRAGDDLGDLGDLGKKAENTSQASAATPDRPIELAIPIDCQLGDDCFVLLYPDTDPSDGVSDFGCGQQSYDTHKGTDFAVASLAELERGVDVLAVADGTVLRLRDGVDDRRLRSQAELDAIAEQGIECGNGIVIDHGDGWTGQYCHLAQGSVAVRQGDRVQRGQAIGRVGVSGKTTFPHVHFTLRYNDDVIDPYTGQPTAAGCNVDRQPLWIEVQEYEPTGIIRLGFADAAPTIDALWDGAYTEPQINTDAPMVLFWAHYYGGQPGDIERYRLLDGAGNVVTEYEQEIDAARLNSMSYVGKRNSAPGAIAPGVWRGEYSLVRNGEVIAHDRAEISIRSGN